MRAEWLALLLLAAGACQQSLAPPAPTAEAPVTQARAPLDLEALVADAPGYVAARYPAVDLPDALARDLAIAGFTCQTSAAATDCSRAELAFASCFDVWSVRIAAGAPVHAEVNRRCMGAMPPPRQQ
jgi:hypothetical protein